MSQPNMSKSLPKPNFFVLGVTKHDFPKMEGSWDDTLAMLAHGKEIDNYFKAHPAELDSLKKAPVTDFKSQINTNLFDSLNTTQKQYFKAVAFKLSFIIIGQKKTMMQEYFSKQQDKKNKLDFYNDVTQIYFINQADLDYLFKQIKG